MSEYRRCPRCWADMFEVGRGALSRTTRDEDGADVEVCSRCGARESLYGYDEANQVPLTEWPLSVDRLVEEERALIARSQAAEMGVIGADELDVDDAQDEEER
jgi:hypothetical protein